MTTTLKRRPWWKRVLRFPLTYVLIYRACRKYEGRLAAIVTAWHLARISLRRNL